MGPIGVGIGQHAFEIARGACYGAIATAVGRSPEVEV